MSAPELSRQAVKTRELLTRLREQGFEFQGRTRELVASVLQTSDSRVGRLTAIREKLVPELLKYFDGDKLGETVAYRLSQEDRTTQLKLAIQLGPAVEMLTKEDVEKVIDQAKRPREPGPAADADGEDGGAPDTSSGANAPPSPQGEGRSIPESTFSAIDGLKKYLDARHDEDARFWQYMQEAADSLIQHSFSAGALPIRKDNIDMLRLDCRNAGSYGGSDGSWSGNNKGVKIGVGVNTIERTWFDTYDALAAIAITRWRAVLTEEQRRPKRKPEPNVGTALTWSTGEPDVDAIGWYAVRVRAGGVSFTMRRYLWWTGGQFTRGPESVTPMIHKDDNVLGWFRLPDEEAKP